MELMTITEVSRQFQVSTRMLRYYEKTGLISSTRMEEYSYRVYDAEAIKRLQQILVLRKLRMPVKQMAVILDDENQMQTLKILQENVQEVHEEIEALSIIRDILARAGRHGRMHGRGTECLYESDRRSIQGGAAGSVDSDQTKREIGKELL